MTEEGILPVREDCVDFTGSELANDMYPSFVAEGSEDGFPIVFLVEDMTNHTVYQRTSADTAEVNPEYLLFSMKLEKPGTIQFATDETQRQTQTQTQTVETIETVETDEGETDEEEDSNDLPPCSPETIYQECADTDDDSEDDTGGSDPDGEESDQNCGGESCTDDEKEDSWTDEEETDEEEEGGPFG